MPGEGHASPYLAEFAPHERQGRVEPELRPSTAPGTAYATVTSDSPSAAGLWGVVPESGPPPPPPRPPPPAAARPGQPPPAGRKASPR